MTDENRGYVHLGDEYGGEYKHESVKHSAKEYVNGMAHTNGIESFWSHVEKRLSRNLSQNEQRNTCRDM